MLVKLLEKDEELITIPDLLHQIKKSIKIDECGAIFTFEGIVRGEEKGKKVDKLILSTPDKLKTQKELESIAREVKEKFSVAEIGVVHYLGEFYTGDSLFLVAVLGNHRQETLDALTEIIERTKFDLDFQKEEHTTKGTNIIMSGG
ncbi:molybdenum cofactor biosynthesis protein MoaE [Methanobacterium alkalithermotolerans]|uniref:Molybdenum cofactor biosynthesis protein MoaE n=1 Tax=Methanobacterium alkalithermotolerans TaxID=2731220 RepID=A0A8T8KBE9_9EURY|nr:molybdenum cofactor biosynthesis protein MoaE [Methanobacterium alkalithermotolerans]QUH24120.1 molybdenum cofactor biosynthesis protein MoaE [Methanobacterium alkalithermotolerans]